MKTRALFLGVVLAATCFASQDAIKIERNFKEGEKDTFKMNASASTGLGTFEIAATVEEHVRKVFENGEAEIESSVHEWKIMVNGMELPEGAGPGKPENSTRRVTKTGVPVGSQGRTGIMSLDFTSHLNKILGSELEVGKTYTVDQKSATDPASRVEGTAKVDSVVDGVAKLTANLRVFSKEGGAKPTRVEMVQLLDVSSSKSNRLQATIRDMPPQAGVPVEIGMLKVDVTRIK
jgi:hypothetical protein